jgi:hypothetical protein
MPKLNRFAKKGEANPLEEIKDTKAREQILGAFRAIEGYVMLIMIAIGLLQILSLKYSMKLENKCFNWLKTRSQSIVTEASMSQFLRRDFFMQFQKRPHLSILQIILSRMDSSCDSNLPNAG